MKSSHRPLVQSLAVTVLCLAMIASAAGAGVAGSVQAADGTADLESVTGPEDGTVTVDLTTSDVEAVTSYSIEIAYDSEVVEFVSVESGDIDVDSSSTSADGDEEVLFFNGFQSTGVNDPTWEITFDLVGEDGDGTELQFLENDTELSDLEDEELVGTLDDGTVEVDADADPDPATIDVGSESGEPDETIDVDVTTDANNVGFYDGEIAYDGDVVEIDDVNSEDMDVEWERNTSGDDTTVEFSAAEEGGVNDPIVTLRFDIVGEPADETPLVFDAENANVQTPVEDTISIESVDDGSVNVDESIDVDEPTVQLGDTVGSEGSTVSVDMTANEMDFASYSAQIAYDDDVLTFEAVESDDIDVGSDSTFSEDGQSFVFFNGAETTDVRDPSWDLTFTVSNESSEETTLSFDDEETTFTNENNENVEPVLKSGSVVTEESDVAVGNVSAATNVPGEAAQTEEIKLMVGVDNPTADNATVPVSFMFDGETVLDDIVTVSPEQETVNVSHTVPLDLEVPASGAAEVQFTATVDGEERQATLDVYELGDATHSGSVSPGDATQVLLYNNPGLEPTADTFNSAAADVTGTGDADVGDAAQISRINNPALDPTTGPLAAED